MAFCEGSVVDAEGKLVAHATGTFKYLKGLPAGGKRPSSASMHPTEGRTMADDQPADPSRLAPDGEADARQLPPRRGSRSASCGDGQVLVRNHFLSLDPVHARPHERRKSYAEPQQLDEVMDGGTVGEVVASKHPDFRPATTSSASAAGSSTPSSTAAPPACCARSTRAAFRCRPTSARSACPASPPGTA